MRWILLLGRLLFGGVFLRAAWHTADLPAQIPHPNAALPAVKPLLGLGGASAS